MSDYQTMERQAAEIAALKRQLDRACEIIRRVRISGGLSMSDPQQLGAKIRRRMTVSAFLTEWEPSEDPDDRERRDAFRADVVALLSQELDNALREVASEKADWSINTSGQAACFAIERRIEAIRLLMVTEKPRWDEMHRDSIGTTVTPVDYWYTEKRAKDIGGGL